MVAKGLRKGYMWEVSWRLNKLQHIDPQIPLSLAAHLSRSAGLLNRGAWGPSPLLGPRSHCLELQQLTPNSLELPVAPGYIIIWHPPASCGRHICTQFNPSTVKVIPRYLRPDAPVPWSTAGSEVNMLHNNNIKTQENNELNITELINLQITKLI